tara:strand:+ start:179 stop:610 length:432 start_codon:yes stop_codon:yes gene_type:complete
MVSVTTNIVIKKPLDEIVSYARDPLKAPEWYVNIKSAEFKTSQPLRIGSQIAFVAQFGGRKLYYVYRIDVLETDRLVKSTSDGPFEMTTTYFWERESKSATRMYIKNEGQPTGFSKLFTPFMSWMMRRATNKDLRKLKEILEG